MITRKKLIEVALPLEKINVASAREKSIRHGHPSTLHLWWARRPLAAARAVIFAQMVDDPSEYSAELLRDPVKYAQAQQTLAERQAAWEIRRHAFESAPVPGERAVIDPGLAPTLAECIADNERQRLFRLIEQLVLWENTTNEHLLNQARDEIWKSWRRTCAENANHPRAAELFNPDKLPAFHDPFAGGGTIPLEAQRLGLESYASDLNPVAVLINKAMLEIPPRFAERKPVNPGFRGQSATIQGMERQWKGAQGLAEDVRYYGQWMRDEAEKRIGQLYPKIEVTASMAQERPDLKPYVGQKLTVIAWLWARTVKSPNPAFAHVDVPMASTFMLSTKPGKEAYVEPVIEGDNYHFTVKVGKPKDAEAAKNGTKLSRGANFQCLISRTPISPDHIYGEANAGRMGAKLMSIVAEGKRGRVYLAPTPEHEAIAQQAQPEWQPDLAMPENPRWFSPPLYGLKTFGDLFTPRQLVALNTFSDLVQEARECVRNNALAAGLPDDPHGLAMGGSGATAYAEAVAVYLAFAQSKACNRNTSLCLWERPMDRLVATFGRQALPMVWDYAETNPIAGAGGDIFGTVISVVEVLEKQFMHSAGGKVWQGDAVTQEQTKGKIVSTDPPYYDNIGYADLSDFFYPWLRRSLRTIFPDLFATLATPKAQELVATPYRHGGKKKAEAFFLDGMRHAMHQLASQTHSAFPVTIYYAFKQSESDGADGTASTGWETFLDAVIDAGFALTGTWPVRTEQPKGLRAFEQNALASSIILVCRPRPQDAPTVTRRDFLAALKDELPVALVHLQRGNIAPVDLAQASIGPGMAVFTRYGKVLDATGKAIGVREALALINATLDEVLADQEGDFDAETRWAVTWFEQLSFLDGEYGLAETLATARNTSVSGMAEAGILTSRSGKVRLLRPDELPATWNPTTDNRLTVWEMVHHLVRGLDRGEQAAAALIAKLGVRADTARDLAYRLYAICERKKRPAEALAYNGLVQSWTEMVRLAGERYSTVVTQTNLFGAE